MLLLSKAINFKNTYNDLEKNTQLILFINLKLFILQGKRLNVSVLNQDVHILQYV